MRDPQYRAGPGMTGWLRRTELASHLLSSLDTTVPSSRTRRWQRRNSNVTRGQHGPFPPLRRIRRSQACLGLVSSVRRSTAGGRTASLALVEKRLSNATQHRLFLPTYFIDTWDGCLCLEHTTYSIVLVRDSLGKRPEAHSMPRAPTEHRARSVDGSRKLTVRRDAVRFRCQPCSSRTLSYTRTLSYM